MSVEDSGTLKRDKPKEKDSETATLKKLARIASLRRPMSVVNISESAGAESGYSGTMVRVGSSSVPNNNATYSSISGTMQFAGNVDSGTMRAVENNSGAVVSALVNPTVAINKEEAVLSELRAALKYFKSDPQSSKGSGSPLMLTPQTIRQSPDIKSLSSTRKIELEALLSEISVIQTQKLDTNDTKSILSQVISYFAIFFFND